MDSKVYMFPDSGSNNGLLSLIGPLLTLKGIDPSVLLAMNKNNYGEGGWFMWIIFLFFLMGWGNWGGNKNGLSTGELAGLINNDAGRELLMQGINGNNAAINQLASTLNCTVSQVQAAINAVVNQVQSSGYENKLAVCDLTNTLQNAINNVATGQERGFSSTAYATQLQTCDLQNTIKDATALILAGQKAAEMREMLSKIDTLRDLNSQKDVIINNSQQTAIFSLMIQQATLPLSASLNALQNDINGMKCRLPETANVPYNPVVGVPAAVAAQFSLNNYGFWS